MLAHKHRRLGHRLLGTPSRELRLEQPLTREQTELLEPRDKRLEHLLVGQVAERRPTPQRERRSQRIPSLARTLVVECPTTKISEPLELEQVDGLSPDAIPGTFGLDRRTPKQLAEIRDVA